MVAVYIHGKSLGSAGTAERQNSFPLRRHSLLDSPPGDPPARRGLPSPKLPKADSSTCFEPISLLPTVLILRNVRVRNNQGVTIARAPGVDLWNFLFLTVLAEKGPGRTNHTVKIVLAANNVVAVIYLTWTRTEHCIMSRLTYARSEQWILSVSFSQPRTLFNAPLGRAVGKASSID